MPILKYTVIFGFSGCLNLKKTHMSKIKYTKLNKYITQVGVNNERVCSEIVESSVVLFRHKFTIPISFTETADTLDGYVGCGLLQCFDFMFSRRKLGSKFNGSVCMQSNAYEGASATPC